MADSQYFHKRHNVTVLIYPLVCPAKYRRVVFSEAVDSSLKEICLELEKRYELIFLESGVDRDHAHFLVQSVPTYKRTSCYRYVRLINQPIRSGSAGFNGQLRTFTHAHRQWVCLLLSFGPYLCACRSPESTPEYWTRSRCTASSKINIRVNMMTGGV